MTYISIIFYTDYEIIICFSNVIFAVNMYLLMIVYLAFMDIIVLVLNDNTNIAS